MARPVAEKKRPPPLPLALPSTFSPPHKAPQPHPAAVAAHDGKGELQEIKSAGLGRSNSTSRFRESTVTTITNLMDKMRGEQTPKKAQHTSNYPHELTQAASNAQIASTVRSHRSERNYRSDPSTAGEENRTHRGEIEKQNERKFFKLMGAVPDTPTDGSRIPDAMVSTTDLRPTRESQDSETTNKSYKEGAKSPKKKIFGLSMPSFKSSSSATSPPPPMPAKVAKVLGTSPAKRRFSPRAKKPTATFQPPRSDTYKSLPSKVFNQGSYHNRSRRADIVGSSATSRSRVRRKSSPKTPQSSPGRGVDNVVTDDNAPTPPEKDTPERVMKWLNRGLTIPSGQDNNNNNNIAMHVPTMEKLDPSYLADHGSRGPAKLGENEAKDYVQLEQGEPIKSAYGIVEHTDTEASETYMETEEETSLPHDPHSAPLEGQQGTKGVNRCSLPPLTPLTARRPEFEYLKTLPATVYVPPSRGDDAKGAIGKKVDKNPPNLASPPKQPHSPEKGKRGSIGIVFRGSVNEINPTPSMGGMSQNASERTSVPHPKGDEIGVPQPAHHLGTAPQVSSTNTVVDHVAGPDFRIQSSARLSDMFGSVSPNRTGFNDFRPSCPSAVPSPLRQGPQPQPQPMAEYPLRLRPSMSMDDHFFVTNEHIDVVACSLWDKIALQATQQTEDTSAKYEKLMTLMGKQFDEVKAHVGSVNDKADHSSHQFHNLSLQLDKVQGLVKEEVAEALGAQSAKMRDMEHSIKDLQKVVHDLQKSVERSHGAASYPAVQSGSGSLPLPNHRSQPSLPGYYDNSGREPMAVQQQTPGHSDGSRSGGNSYFSRTGYAGREAKDADNPFSRMNPYYTPSAQVGSGFVQAGGFGPYGCSPTPDNQQFPPHYGPGGSAK